MARAPRSIVPEEPQDASAWSAVVLMASSVGAFALLALFLAYNHRWTDAMLAALPNPGGLLRPAGDGIVAEQVRITNVRTEPLMLSDRTMALLVEADVTNDAALPVRGIVLEIEGFQEGRRVAGAHGTCGKSVSLRLLRRLSLSEVQALMALESSVDDVVQPGQATGCQVALTPLRTEIDEVSYRIASAEPTADHSSEPDPTPRPPSGE